ncbi:hypothetical protein LCGC14_1138140 [marine sediment metagenome]|uniref:Cdc6 AAA+ ATPase-type lid domain-containing protein n=1 Tax=marine sediment metagenome TaxID=412755 RepID=A0A0F9PHA2_9ZZZZ|nr:MAG: Orc1/cdc6 family related protein [Candidatus Lokiarchaeum sp. GC14_75]HEA70954.1 hypothetical protein [archaeon]
MSILGLFQTNGIYLERFSKNQIFDILKFRAERGLRKNVITDKIIEEIAEIAFTVGDIRYGINLLWKSAKISESKELSYISSECIKEADGKIINSKIQEY